MQETQLHAGARVEQHAAPRAHSPRGPRDGGKEVRALRRLARAYGVQDSYTDGMGRRRIASPEALLAVLRCMGAPVERAAAAGEHLRQLEAARAERLCEPVIVAWLEERGAPAVRLELEGRAAEVVLEEESGQRRTWSVAEGGEDCAAAGDRGATLWRGLPRDLGVGVHSMTVRCGGREERATVLAAPRRCRGVDGGASEDGEGGGGSGPAVGVFLPLYAAHSDDSAGIGELADLRDLVAWAGGCGCRFFGTLPLLACFLDEPFEPSPYAPISRLVFGEVFLDIRRKEEWETPESRRLLESDEVQRAFRALRGGEEEAVDYARVWRVKRRVLASLSRAAFENEQTRREIERFGREVPLAARYARFRGAMARLGSSAGVWRTWPPQARAGSLRDSDIDEDERRLFLYAQWRLHRRMQEVADTPRRTGCSLYMDLPIGVHGDGFDVWERQELFAAGAELGAPPDAFFASGQRWGFPPVIPDASRAEGHAYFAASVDHHARWAGALRIDHAAGLHRCFWVPDGMSAEDGMYVKQPAEELYAVLSIASHRHRTIMVGENLGTVPREVDRSLRRRGVLGMRIAQFELGGDHAVPQVGPGALWALNTHDLSTFAAFWTGTDIDLHLELGLLNAAADDAERAKRAAMREAVSHALGLAERGAQDPALVARTLLVRMASSRPELLLVNMEDLWGEMRPHNVPGMAYPLTWRRRAARSLEEITEDAFLKRVVESLTGAGVLDGAGGGARGRPVRGGRGAGSQER